MPAEPTSADEVNKGEDENIKEPVEVEDEDIGSPSPLPPVRFISVWKAVIGGRKVSLPSTRLALLDTKNIYCQTLSRLMEMIHMILYEEEVSGAVAREGKYTRPARCHVTYRPSSKRLPKHHPPTNTPP